MSWYTTTHTLKKSTKKRLRFFNFVFMTTHHTPHLFKSFLYFPIQYPLQSSHYSLTSLSNPYTSLENPAQKLLLQFPMSNILNYKLVLLGMFSFFTTQLNNNLNNNTKTQHSLSFFDLNFSLWNGNFLHCHLNLFVVDGTINVDQIEQ